MSNAVCPVSSTGELVVKKIDGYYLYQVGASIHPLSEITKGTSFSDALLPILIAHGSLQGFLEHIIFRPRMCRQKGNELLDILQEYKSKAVEDEDGKAIMGAYEIYRISKALTSFETVLGAEFGALADIYLVAKKRGFDTTDLIERGTVLFPDDLIPKVPNARLDVEQAARCIAFELPTAAGFHLHRANESVLHAYYDSVTNGAPRPSGRNIGDYLAELKRLNVGSPIVLSALKDLKDLHRNPLIHPEHTLADIDEALALLGSIQSVIVHMLKAIPLFPDTVMP